MSEFEENQIYIWSDPEERFLSDVLQHLKNNCEEIVVLNFPDSPTFHEAKPLVKYLLDLCYNFKLFTTEHTTVLNYKDHLLALELCISRLKGKEISISKEEIKECHEAHVNKYFGENVPKSMTPILDSYEEFLVHSNCFTLWKLYNVVNRNINMFQNHFAKLQYLLIGSPKWNILVEFVKLLIGDKKLRKIITETSLNVSIENSPSNSTKNVIISDETLSLEDLVVESKSRIKKSATEEYAGEVILAFLNLIVNSRNELALSKAMISPLINLSHTAFTDLKHMSIEKEMSMCQTVISYVTKLRLGGKGYAPSASCPLLIYLKAFEQFVDLLNQLYTIIEEDMSDNAVKRVINIIKKKLIKCDKLKADSIEKVAQELIETSSFLHRFKPVNVDSNRIGQKSFNTLYDLVNFMAYSGVLDSAEQTPGSTKRTPLNVPPLMGYFRTPEEEISMDANSQSSIRSSKSIQLEIKKDLAPVISYFHNSESNSVSKSCINDNTPTKTTFRGCLSKDLPNNKNERQPLAFNQNKPSIKRMLISDNTRKATNKKSKKQQPKGKVQIKGQGSITGFFIRKD